jgi:indolepyruvate ferredoxin oxidoreductase beta subunit
MTYNIITTGVGGQGLMLLSDIIGKACAAMGLNIKTAETHGLAQRSGTISTHVRIGETVLSPLIPYGEANVMVSMEAIEALRQCEYIADGATIIINKFIWHPIQSTFIRVKSFGKTPYVTFDEIRERLLTITPDVRSIDCLALANEAGNPQTTNTVLIGALACVDGFPITIDALEQALTRAVPPKTLDSNLRALHLGYEACGSMKEEP